MTYQDDFTLPTELLEQVAEQGLDFLPELIRIVINNAMQVERQKYLGVGPYERSTKRQGHANGYKPKTVSTRIASIFANEASCLRLVSAVLMEIRET
jgi:putative transposase